MEDNDCQTNLTTRNMYRSPCPHEARYKTARPHRAPEDVAIAIAGSGKACARQMCGLIVRAEFLPFEPVGRKKTAAI